MPKKTSEIKRLSSHNKRGKRELISINKPVITFKDGRRNNKLLSVYDDGDVKKDIKTTVGSYGCLGGKPFSTEIANVYHREITCFLMDFRVWCNEADATLTKLLSEDMDRHLSTEDMIDILVQVPEEWKEWFIASLTIEEHL